MFGDETLLPFEVLYQCAILQRTSVSEATEKLSITFAVARTFTTNASPLEDQRLFASTKELNTISAATSIAHLEQYLNLR